MRFSRLLRTFTVLVGARTVGRLVRFVYFIFIAQAFTPAELGTYTYALSTYLALLLVGSFGQVALLGARLSRGGSPSQRLASHSLTVRLVATAVVAAVGLLVAPVFEQGAVARTTVALMVLAAVARSFVFWIREAFIAMEDVRWIPKYELGFRGLEAVLGIVWLQHGGGLVAVAFLHLATWLAEAALTANRLGRRSPLRMRLGRGGRMLRVLVAMSTVLMLSLALFHVNAQVGVIALKVLRAAGEDVGFFGTAMQFFSAALILPMALGHALLPAVGRAARLGDRESIGGLSVALKGALATGAIVAILAQGLAGHVLPFLLGAEHVHSARALGFVSWALGAYGVVVIGGQALNALGHRAPVAWIGALMVVVQVALVSGLLGGGAIAAASIALIASAGVGGVVTLVVIGPRLGRAGQRWWVPAAVLVCLAALPVNAFGLPAGPATAPLCAAVALAAFASLDRDELRLLREKLGLPVACEREEGEPT